jgi:RNA polymerase sigma-70 factor (ECF subfamily)
LVAKDAARRLQSALDAMDPAHSAVFILFEIEAESCESIAAGLGVPVGTVHSRLHAARRAFRKSAALSEPRDDGAPGQRFREKEIHVMVVKEPT